MIEGNTPDTPKTPTETKAHPTPPLELLKERRLALERKRTVIENMLAEVNFNTLREIYAKRHRKSEATSMMNFIERDAIVVSQKENISFFRTFDNQLCLSTESLYKHLIVFSSGEDGKEESLRYFMLDMEPATVERLLARKILCHEEEHAMSFDTCSSEVRGENDPEERRVGYTVSRTEQKDEMLEPSKLGDRLDEGVTEKLAQEDFIESIRRDPIAGIPFSDAIKFITANEYIFGIQGYRRETILVSWLVELLAARSGVEPDTVWEGIVHGYYNRSDFFISQIEEYITDTDTIEGINASVFLKETLLMSDLKSFERRIFSLIVHFRDAIPHDRFAAFVKKYLEVPTDLFREITEEEAQRYTKED